MGFKKDGKSRFSTRPPFGRNTSRSSGFGPKPGFGGKSRSFGSRPTRGNLELFDMKCDKCGRDCQVPFKPTGDRPVYCRDCFSKNDDRPQRKAPSNHSADELAEINEKLDKIMRALDID
jgi:CxxC-x17-CxxC domain-containing protein